MKIKRNMISALTACMMLCSMGTALPVFAEGTEGTYESLTYTNYGSYIAITDCDETVTEVEIPAFIDNIEVTEIARSAFSRCDVMTSITLPDGITSIGDGAFDSCESLTTIHIPARVGMIGEKVFEDCSALESITVVADNGLYKSVDGVLMSKTGESLLYYPAGKTDSVYTVPDGVHNFPYFAFDGCDNLTEIILPASVDAYDANFKNCDSLTKITVAEDNTFCKSVDGVLYSENGMILLCYPAGKTDKYFAVPDGTAELAEHAFSGNMNILSVTTPESLQVIGNSAFYDCMNVQSITLPDYMQSIGSDAFGFCYDLTTLKLPSEVGTIGSWTFCYCQSLTELTLPDDLTVIYAGMFQGCSGLTTLTLPSSVTSIEMYGFYDCSGLTSITIPAGVTAISDGAFDGCTSLTDVYFTGTEAEWNAVTIGIDNDPLLNAAVHFDGSAPVTPSVSTLGDLNSDTLCNASDAAVLLTAAAAAGAGGASGLTAELEAAADVNASGGFDAADAALILQYAAYAGTGGTQTLEEFIASMN